MFLLCVKCRYKRLRQFRKVDKSKPSIDFVDFDSEEGQELLAEYEGQ
jgi:hypothetical protein